MPSTSRFIMRVLVTRPQEDASRTAELLAARGHEALCVPFFEVRRLNAPLPERADAVLAASANALRMADPAALMRLTNAPFFAVGAATAAAARAAGFREIEVGEGDAAALAALVRLRCKRGATLLHLAGLPRRDEAIAALSDEFRVIVSETYETIAVDSLPASAISALQDGSIDAVLHLSPRASLVFADLAERAGLLDQARRLRHVFISEAAVDPRLAPGRVATRPDLETVISAL